MRRALSHAKLRPPRRTIRGLSGNTHACEDALRSYERDGIFSPDTLAALTASMPPTPVSINQLSMAGRRASAEQSLLNARFIHAELIARRAAMLQQFQEMPEELANAAGVQELAKEIAPAPLPPKQPATRPNPNPNPNSSGLRRWLRASGASPSPLTSRSCRRSARCASTRSTTRSMGRAASSPTCSTPGWRACAVRYTCAIPLPTILLQELY